MKKLINKVYLVMYRVYNCDQEGTNKAKPFDFLYSEEKEYEECIFDTSALARSFASLLVIILR